jgi:hypothetical protein
MVTDADEHTGPTRPHATTSDDRQTTITVSATKRYSEMTLVGKGNIIGLDFSSERDILRHTETDAAKPQVTLGERYTTSGEPFSQARSKPRPGRHEWATDRALTRSGSRSKRSMWHKELFFWKLQA